MPSDPIVLARRALACRGWRWMPGMANLTKPGERVVKVSDGGSVVWGRPYQDNDAAEEHWTTWLDDDGWETPDLDDPATLGCLLALVREAHPDAAAIACVPQLDGAGWRVESHLPPYDLNAGQPDDVLGEGITEAEALVMALEAARLT